MAKNAPDSGQQPGGGELEEAGLREKVEIYLFLAVEILCLLLFVDFLNL